MAEQPEARLQRKICEALNKLPDCYAEKVHGGMFGKQKLDIVGGINGKLFWLEVKTPGSLPTEKQLATMRKWENKAKAMATWTNSVEDAVRTISELNQLEQEK